MPPKRPAPLSDAALLKREGGTVDASNAAQPANANGALGETNAGVPLPVKNTFIDLPSGLTPIHSPRNKDNLRTAPAQVNCTPGFVQRAVRASMQEASPSDDAPPVDDSAGSSVPAEPSTASTIEPPGGVSAVAVAFHAPPNQAATQPVAHVSPKRSALVQPTAIAQRPCMPGQQDWPLATPSPTGASNFTAARYQLFGGPTLTQEAPHTALGLGVGQPATFSCIPGAVPGGSTRPVLATSGPLGAHQPVVAQQIMSYGGARTFTVAGTAQPVYPRPPNIATTVSNVPASLVATIPAASSASAVGSASAPAPNGEAAPNPPTKVEQVDKDDDDDDDSDAERQQQQQQAGRSPEDAPKPPPGALHPSLGSENHAEGTCKRCCFFPRNRCNNGYDCDFCHYEHEKRKRKNKKSKKKNKEGNTDAAAVQAALAPTTISATASAGPTAGADVWSTSFGDDGQARPEPSSVATSTPVGQPKDTRWSFHWIDDPRQTPGPFDSQSSYFIPATGLHSPATTTPLSADLQMAQPLFAQPLCYQPSYQPCGVESIAVTAAAANVAVSPWGGSSMQSPYVVYPSVGEQTQTTTILDLTGSSPSATAAVTSTTAVSSPPTEAPKLPHALQQGPTHVAPPPQAAPNLLQVSGALDEDDKPPPPVSSPKLSSDVLMSLKLEPPPVPGDLPI